MKNFDKQKGKRLAESDNFGEQHHSGGSSNKALRVDQIANSGVNHREMQRLDPTYRKLERATDQGGIFGNKSSLGSVEAFKGFPAAPGGSDELMALMSFYQEASTPPHG
jgi:hypothetical protein